MGDDEASELLARFAERRVRRETVRLGEESEDLEWDLQPDGHWVLPVREGHAIMLPGNPGRGAWDLYMHWHGDYGHAPLARGTRAVVEVVARRVQRTGPSCGPEFKSSATRWLRFDDDTEHSSIKAGELRLMQPVAFLDGVLLLAQRGEPDTVAVLGMAATEMLRENAEALASRVRGSLHVHIGDRPRYLRALGANGLVGYLEFGDDLFVLGHLGDGEFGLAWQSGDEQRGLGKYTLREVMRGDLGSVLEGTRPPVRAAPSARAGSVDPKDRPTIPKGPMARPWRHRLAGPELEAAHKHLTPSKGWIGEASSVIPRILGAIRDLVHRDFDNQTFWAKNFLLFLAKHTKKRIHCCRKILNAALHVLAGRTNLLVRQGRRWVLRLGDLRARGSRLLQWMIWRGPLDSKVAPPEGSKQGHTEPARAPAAADADVAVTADKSPTSTDTTTPPATEPKMTDTDASPSTDAPPITRGPKSTTTDAAGAELTPAPYVALSAGGPSPPPASSQPAPHAATPSDPSQPAPHASPPSAPSQPAPHAATPSDPSQPVPHATTPPSQAAPHSSPPSAPSQPAPHAAAASGNSPTPPMGNRVRLPPGSPEWTQLFATMSPPGNPALPPGSPPWLTFEAFQTMIVSIMRGDSRRHGRGPGVTFRGPPSWADDDEPVDPTLTGPRVPRGASGKRRHRPP